MFLTNVSQFVVKAHNDYTVKARVNIISDDKHIIYYALYHEVSNIYTSYAW